MTADHVLPKAEVAKSVDELSKHGRSNARSGIFWLSWRKLLPILERVPIGMPERMKRDLTALLGKRGFRTFQGFRIQMPAAIPNLRFWRSPSRATDATAREPWFSRKIKTPVGPGLWWRSQWEWGGEVASRASRMKSSLAFFRRSS